MGMNVAEISGHMARKFLGLSQKQKVKLEQQAAILTGEVVFMAKINFLLLLFHGVDVRVKEYRYY